MTSTKYSHALPLPAGALALVPALILAVALILAPGCDRERADFPPGEAAAGVPDAHGHDQGERPHNQAEPSPDQGAPSVEAPHAHAEAGGETCDLDRPIEQLLADRCEHGIATYTCDECRYETGIVKVSPDLLDADGPLETASAALRATAAAHAHNGEVRLNEERAAYLSPRAAGTVQAIFVDLGSVVQRGEVLFTVDSPEFAEARAAFVSARAAARLAEATLERERDLYEKRVCPRKDLLEAEAAREGAAATCQAARERLLACGLSAPEIDDLGTDPDAHGGPLPVKAPFAGTVLERNIGLGASVEPGQPLLLLGDTSEMWIWTSLYEREMASVLARQTRGEVLAHVEVPAYPDRVFSGRVERIGGILDEATRTVKVRVVVRNPEGLLRAGMFARVRLLDGSAEQVVAIPAEAVLEDEGRSFVFVPTEPPYFVRRPVVTGRAWDEYVEITQGLADGDVVVTRGAFTLKSDVLRSKMGAGCAD
jgi:cobalt-zinc-cadmium efflux system membrane fusion protein